MSKKELRRAAKEAKGQEREDCFPKHPARTKVIKEAVSKFQPRTEGQSEYVKAIAEHPITLAIGPAGTGKAQPLNSKILTPTGWQLMRNIAVGDQIMTPEGRISRVVEVFPQGKKDIYTITFHDGSSAKCCAEHLWKCYTRKYWEGANPQVINTAEIRKLIEKGVVVSIPLTQPQGGEDCELPMDPYLLGALIGDGCFLQKRILFTTLDDFILEEVNKCTSDKDCFVKKIKSSHCDYVVTNKNPSRHKASEGLYGNYFIQILGELGLLGHKAESKFIPQIYKQASIAQKFALVQGLMDTDGTVGKRARAKSGGASFTTVSLQLAKDMQEILWSLGATCTITNRIPTYTYKNKKLNGQLAYTLHIGYVSPKLLFRLPRKRERCLEQFNDGRTTLRRRIKSIELTSHEEAQCILIDSPQHLYITDDYVVTHNTFISIAIAMQDLADSKFDKIVLTRPAIEAAGEKLGFLPGDVSEKLDPYMIPLYDSLDKVIGKVARKKLMEEGVIEIVPLAYMRGRTLDKSFIILDEAQNCTPMQIKMLMTRLGIDARLVITGDLNQSDISNAWDNSHNKMRNGLEDAVLRFNNDKDIAVVCLRLCDIQRHPLITHIIKTYELGLPSTTMEDIYKNK